PARRNASPTVQHLENLSYAQQLRDSIVPVPDAMLLTADRQPRALVVWVSKSFPALPTLAANIALSIPSPLLRLLARPATPLMPAARWVGCRTAAAQIRIPPRR